MDVKSVVMTLLLCADGQWFESFGLDMSLGESLPFFARPISAAIPATATRLQQVHAALSNY
jgi:hypothetical protein